MTADVQLRGLPEVEAALVRLGKTAGARVIKQAMFAATKPILEQAKSNIRAWPRGSGALELAMGRTFNTNNVLGIRTVTGGGRFVTEIGPRRKVPRAVSLYNFFYGRRKKGIFYGHLLEFGHRIATRRTGYLRKSNASNKRRFSNRGGGINQGQVRPQRFLKPALDMAGLRAVFEFRNQMERRVTRALKKLDAAAEKV